MLFTLALVTVNARAQWNIQQSHTTVSFRSVHAVSEMVAWASGANGTVLRTMDGGENWHSCAFRKERRNLTWFRSKARTRIPQSLSLRGKVVSRAFTRPQTDARPGGEFFSNPDASGSFKSIHRITNRQLYLLGDPVDGKFSMFYSADGGET